MSKLIFFTGFRGSGKSHAAKAWAVGTNSIWIDGDHLFSTSLMAIRPDLDDDKRNDWNEWPNERRTVATASQVCNSTIHGAAYYVQAENRPLPANLSVFRGHALVDGAIFANDWFRQATQEVLMGLGNVIEDVNLLYFNPSDDVIWRNIQRRGRKDEIAKFPDVATVTRHNHGFRTHFGTSRQLWKELTTSTAMNAELQRLLCAD